MYPPPESNPKLIRELKQFVEAWAPHLTTVNEFDEEEGDVTFRSGKIELYISAAESDFYAVLTMPDMDEDADPDHATIEFRRDGTLDQVLNYLRGQYEMESGLYGI